MWEIVSSFVAFLENLNFKGGLPVFGFWSLADAMKQTIIKDNGPGGFYISFDARTLQEYHFGVVIGIRTHLKFTFLK